jgi:WD40 repeat protein
MFTLTEPTGVVQSLAFHPSGLALSAAGADKTIRTWELTPTANQNRPSDSDKENATDSPPSESLSKTAASKTAAGKTADDDESEVRVPPVRVGADARSIRGHNAPILRIAYSPDGKWLASSDDDGVVKIWEAATGKEMRALEKQPDWAQGLDWSPDGSRIAIGRYDGTVGVYDAATGRRVASLGRGSAGRRTVSASQKARP